MRKLKLLSAAAILGFSLGSLAQDRETMNGYRLAQFGDFTKWKLVTVRYRKDTDEMRFVYANELAWKTLSANGGDYPDGAIFAKVGAMTQPDPAFVSSSTPGGVRRVQLMVRDRERHKDADGWGYALFDTDGKVLAEDQKLTTQACVACHRLVPERGEVFSQIFTFAFGKEIARASTAATTTPPARLEFADGKTSALPRAVRAHLPKSISRVRVVRGSIAENPFAGTLDEVQPFLAAEAVRTSVPAVLVSKDGKKFSLVFRARVAKACAEGQTPLTGIHTLPSSRTKLFENSFCQ